MATAQPSTIRESDVLTLATVHQMATEAVSATEHKLTKAEIAQMVIHRIIAKIKQRGN